MLFALVIFLLFIAKMPLGIAQDHQAWALQQQEQSQELMKANVPCLHYYTMGASEATRRVAKEVF